MIHDKGTIMINHKQLFSIGIILVSLSSMMGCSVISKVGKTAKNMTTFGKHKEAVAVDDSLVIPPTLRVPENVSKKPSSAANNTSTKSKAVYVPSKNYYIVVGTYPDQVDALDTFVRLSSIGLKGATMESRKTKAGKSLHMVRLGPYQKQEDIDKAKDSLTSDGLSQFKVVEN